MADDNLAAQITFLHRKKCVGIAGDILVSQMTFWNRRRRFGIADYSLASQMAFWHRAWHLDCKTGAVRSLGWQTCFLLLLFFFFRLELSVSV